MHQPIVDAQVVSLFASHGRSGRAVIEGLYDLYADRIFRYLLVRVGEPDAADGLTTEVFMRAMRHIQTFRLPEEHPAASVSAWLYRIAASIASNYHRTQRRRPLTCAMDEWRVADGQDEPAQSAEEVEKLNALLEAVNRLSEDQRLVILGKFGEEMSNAEVASMIGKSEGAVKSLQHRALRTLARLLGAARDRERKGYGDDRHSEQSGRVPAESA